MPRFVRGPSNRKERKHRKRTRKIKKGTKRRARKSARISRKKIGGSMGRSTRTRSVTFASETNADDDNIKKANSGIVYERFEGPPITAEKEYHD